MGQGMLTSFMLLAGHVLVVFRSWQSTQEPWAGQGEAGRTVSPGLFIQQTLRKWHEAERRGMRKKTAGGPGDGVWAGGERRPCSGKELSVTPQEWQHKSGSTRAPGAGRGTAEGARGSQNEQDC